MQPDTADCFFAKELAWPESINFAQLSMPDLPFNPQWESLHCAGRDKEGNFNSKFQKLKKSTFIC